MPISKKISIYGLATIKLKNPIEITVEPDDNGFIAKMIDFNLYCYDNTEDLAIEGLKWEIEDAFNDLLDDNNLTNEWNKFREYIRLAIK